MHSTQLAPDIWANHNGDFSGDVYIQLKPERVSVENVDVSTVSIPFFALKRLVAEYVMRQKIAALEEEEWDDVLLGLPRRGRYDG